MGSGHRPGRVARRGRRKAGRIRELGISHFILSGYPHLEEAYWFGEGVLPLLERMGLWRKSSPTASRSRPRRRRSRSPRRTSHGDDAAGARDGAGRDAIAEGHDESDTQRRRRLRIVIAASLLGTTVEWYDFFLYATAAGLVFNKVFFPNASSWSGTLLAFATFAVGFVMRPIGGLVFGHRRPGRPQAEPGVDDADHGFGDGVDRGVAHRRADRRLGADLLLVLRILQGFALGGEWGGAVLLAVEHSPGDRRGRFGAVPQVGLALGLALGTAYSRS